MTAASRAIGTPATVKASPPAKAKVEVGVTSPKAWRQPSMPRRGGVDAAQQKSVEPAHAKRGEGGIGGGTGAGQRRLTAGFGKAIVIH